MKNFSSINKEQKLFLLKSGAGFSCLGFEVVIKKAAKLAIELGIKPPKFRAGSLASLKFYYKLIAIASKKNQSTGWRSKSDLVPEFIGHEGKRIEVIFTYGEK